MSKSFKLIQGNEACANASIKAGVSFFAGYPITPSTEIMEIMSRNLPLIDGAFIQMEDEISSIAAVLGASLTGAKAMTATSGPGFSLMQEHIGYAVIAEIPSVIINVQRLGPSTGSPTSTSQGDVLQSKRGSHGDYELIALSPSSVEECYYLTIKAFNLSEKFRCPVILLLEEITGHLRESVNLKNDFVIIDRKKPAVISSEKYKPYQPENNGVPLMANYGEGYRFHVTGLMHDETGFPCTGNNEEIAKLQLRLRNKLLNNYNEILIFDEYETNDADILIVAYGSTVRSALAAIKETRKYGMKTGLLALKTIWPFPYDLIKEKSRGKKQICVVEQNFGQIISEIYKSAVNNSTITQVNHFDGTMIKPGKIITAIKG